MKERPILFSGSMIRALLTGRKTQTRRVVKDGQLRATAWGDPARWAWDSATATRCAGKECPYGQPGDRLWCKEGLKRGFMPNFLTGEPLPNVPTAYYAADDSPVLTEHGGFDISWTWKNKTLPGMFCPRWASRLTLEVESIRVERLQDISEEDAKAEGVEPKRPAGSAAIYEGPVHLSHIVAFRELWCDINGTESWDANPWVWVVSFKVAEARHV